VKEMHALITIQKKELEGLEATVKELKELVAREQHKLKVAEGLRAYNTILYLQTQVLLQHAMVRIAILTPCLETKECKATLDNHRDKIDKTLAGLEDELLKTVDAWYAYLKENPDVKPVFNHLKIAPMPVVQ
jgi:hypothetical protein